jgi:Family of unknown function (DUF6256)/Family of unknown function (DUF6186)
MSDTSQSASRNVHAFGLTGWVVIIGLVLAWEGLGLAFAREGWPSMSDLLRAVSRPAAGRWILLALWIWLGWHLFVRGWQPLLRGTPPTPALSQTALSAGQLVRQVLVPLLAAFVALAAALLFGVRRRASGEIGSVAPPSVANVVRRVATTVVAGYAGFLVLVVGYYALVAGQTPAFLHAAVSGGAFITFAVALPGLLLLSGAEALLRRRGVG